MQIRGAAGEDNGANVDKTTRLWTRSVESAEREQSILNGDAYRVETPEITLISSNESAVLFFKNNGSRDINIHHVHLKLLGSTGGSGGYATIKIYRNPDGGTILSEKKNIVPVNVNFGSNNSIDADTYYGEEGDTHEGTVLFTGKKIKDTEMFMDSDKFTLKKGNSFIVTVTPPSGNTSMSLKAEVSCYLLEERK